MRKYTQQDTYDSKSINLEFGDVDSRITLLEKNDPVGVLKLWSGVSPPPGYLWCDGTEYAVEEYPQLFDTMEFRGGTPIGGAGKFVVPSLTVGNFRYIVKAK